MNQTETLPVSEPVPPLQHQRTAGHHWLDVYDSDGHYFDRRVLQWNPVAKRWTHSGQVATGLFVEVRYWRYVDVCPMSDLMPK